MKNWSFEGYWDAVFGIRSPAQVVSEFSVDLSGGEAGVSEWVYTAEYEAAHQALVKDEAFEVLRVWRDEDFGKQATRALLDSAASP